MSPEPDDRMAAALMELGETMTRVLEAVVGYRCQCEAAGFSKAVAEQMAAEYHAKLVQAM